MNRLCLLLGAGFSKWSVNLPVAKDLFDFNITLDGPKEKRKIEKVIDLKQSWHKDHPHSHSEQFIEYSLSPSGNNSELVIWYVVRRLSEPFIWREGRRRHVLMIDENRKFGVNGMSEASNFINKCNLLAISGIITTNYDMIVEYSLGTKGFNYRTDNEYLKGRGPYPVSTWLHPIKLTGKIPLIKLHGSINWDDQGRYTDGRRGLTGRAKIIPPISNKQPINLTKEWSLAEEILRSSKTLLVFGFAFNNYDNSVLDLLSRGGQNLESILLVNVNSKTYSAKELWPNADGQSCKPPPKWESEITRWLDTIPGKLGFI